MVMCEEDMKILLLSPNKIKKRNWGHQLFKNEIGKQYDTTYYGQYYKGYNPNYTVQDIISKYCKSKPDAIITYCTSDKQFIGLDKVKNIIKVHFILDYVDGMIKTQNKRIIENKYDIVFAFTQLAMNRLRSSNIMDDDMSKVLPFSVDTNVYRNMKLKKYHDVMAVFTVNPKYYPNRSRVISLVKNMNVKSITNYIIHNKMIETINRSKINITSNNRFKSLSLRYTETLACGGFLLADRPDDLDILELIDGEHLVIYNDLKDLKDKILYYLSHNKERKKIAKQGEDFVRENHSCEVRVKEMIEFITKKTGIK